MQHVQLVVTENVSLHRRINAYSVTVGHSQKPIQARGAFCYETILPLILAMYLFRFVFSTTNMYARIIICQ